MSQDFTISYDLDRRHHFRVRPNPAKPLLLSVSGKQYRVLDISAGGFAYLAHGLKNGQTASAVILLPGQEEPVEMTFQIVSIKPNGLAAATILTISDEHRELIHQYVLKRQKEIIEEQKAKPDKK